MGAHGKTIEMIEFVRETRLRHIGRHPREPRFRDRTLRGKARIRARKAARRGEAS